MQLQWFTFVWLYNLHSLWQIQVKVLRGKILGAEKSQWMLWLNEWSWSNCEHRTEKLQFYFLAGSLYVMLWIGKGGRRQTEPAVIRLNPASIHLVISSFSDLQHFISSGFIKSDQQHNTSITSVTKQCMFHFSDRNKLLVVV